MKVVMITIGLPPYVSGVATSTVSLAQELSKNHSVTVISGSRNGKQQRLQQSAQLKYWLLPGVNLKVRSNLIIPYPYPKKIEKILTELTPDIVHLHDIGPLSLSGMAAARKLKIPVIMTHHFTAEYVLKTIFPSHFLSNRLSQNTPTKQLIYDLVKSIYNSCQLVTVPSDSLIPYFQKAKLKPPIMAISNGITVSRFRRRQNKAITLKQFGINQKQIVLSVGRLDVDKSLHLLIEAFATLAPLNPDACLVFVGDGNKRQELEKQTRHLNLTNSVYFLGKVDHDSPQLSYLYNAATVFASPSLIESQGVVFLEAMAAGLPVVAIDNPVLRGTITPFNNGLLVPSNQPADMATAIQLLLSDKALRHSISQRNRKEAQKFDIATTAKRYLAAYQKALR